MIKHNSLPSFKLEISKHNLAPTSFAGIPLIRQALKDIGLIDEMKKVFTLKTKGYEDTIVLEALILLIASGGRSLSDWESFIADPGVAKMFEHHLSVDTLERYLKKLEVTLENPGQVDYGQAGYSGLLEKVHEVLIKKAYQLAGSPLRITLDLDASLFSTHNREALFCYEKVKAYHPFMVYCPELGMVIAHEFRDGNISPALGYQRLIKRCQKLFPRSRFVVRSDSAGYQLELMTYCCENKMAFFITADQSSLLKKLLEKQKDWVSLVVGGIKTDQEFCEIPYVFTSHVNLRRKKLRLLSRSTRFIVIRKPKNQTEIFDSDYVYQAIATNTIDSAEEVIQTHRGRCGSVEYAFSQVKSGLNLRMPSNFFKVNAAFFSLGLITHNLLKLLQNHILPKKLKKVELQTLRFRFLRTVAFVKYHARQFVLRCCKDHPLYNIYQHAMNRLNQVCWQT